MVVSADYHHAFIVRADDIFNAIFCCSTVYLYPVLIITISVVKIDIYENEKMGGPDYFFYRFQFRYSGVNTVYSGKMLIMVEAGAKEQFR